MSSPINIELMMNELGFEGFGDLSGTDERLFDLLTAAKAGFSDGDVVIVHEPYADQERAELFGEASYNEGTVAKALGEASLYADPFDTERDIHRFQNFIAAVVTQDIRSGAQKFGADKSAISMGADSVIVDDNFIAPIEANPNTLLVLGSCLSSRGHIEDQIRSINNGQPYSLVSVARNHFVNRMLIEQYGLLLQSELARKLLDNRFFIGREDGAAEATRSIIEEQEAHGSPTNIMDVVVMATTQHMSREDIFDSIPRVQRIMTDTGRLILRGFDAPSDSEIGIDEMLEAAQDNGLVVSESGGYETTDHIDFDDMLLGINKPRRFRSASLKLREH